MFDIIPAILPKSVEDLLEKINLLPAAITFFHMDVLEEDIWASEISRDFEVHLMVEEPEKIMERWIERGAKRLSVHTAGNSLAKYREKLEIGLAVDLEKPLEEVFPFLDFVDFIHLMSTKEVGAQGRPFDPRIFDRIKEIRATDGKIPISVDGGIDENNYKQVIEAGATRLIVGHAFKALWHSLTTK